MRTSTVRFRNLDALDRAQADKADPEKRSVTYGRSGMDTHAALEQVFCQLSLPLRLCWHRRAWQRLP